MAARWWASLSSGDSVSYTPKGTAGSSRLHAWRVCVSGEGRATRADRGLRGGGSYQQAYGPQVHGASPFHAEDDFGSAEWQRHGQGIVLAADPCLAKVADGERARTPQHVP